MAGPSSTQDSSGTEGDVETNNNNGQLPKEGAIVSEKRSWLAQRLETEVSLKHADLVFVLCSFLSGLCDSSTYNAWNCFVSMQTGNTVFLALGASNQSLERKYGWLKSLVSISSFLAGSFVFSNTRRFRPQSRRTLMASFAVQSLLIVIAASLLQSGLISDSISPSGQSEFLQLIPLSLIAFQCAGQMAASRLLSFNEIPTTVLTSVYYDIASDPGILHSFSKNLKRNRRCASVVAIVGGAILGGWLARLRGGIATAFWIAAGLKFCVMLSWWFWKPAVKKQPDESDA
ncbi:hypothetical protein AJ80_05187 [Polytolypa hystricis UAMH7299]|uniref:DUF1275 domain-containing protein n=1 Tax=Polytolypa hystricis (strain UAMH7299) TaxID=1447883 RepID=A0A2B7Y6J6_POLH7|nr:hypothetical protein AJ80_05187 [Polytolypa hystricis UAMH7299]